MITSLFTLALLALAVGVLITPVMIGLEYLLEVRLKLSERLVSLSLGIFILPILSISVALGLTWIINFA